MSVSQHCHANINSSCNQKNQMSKNPGDGVRNEPSNQIPDEQRRDVSLIEAFSEEGAGIAAKE